MIGFPRIVRKWTFPRAGRYRLLFLFLLLSISFFIHFTIPSTIASLRAYQEERLAHLENYHYDWTISLEKDLITGKQYGWLPHSIALIGARILANRDWHKWTGTRYPIEELIAAPHPSTFLPLPELTRPVYEEKELVIPFGATIGFGKSSVKTRQLVSPAYVALHTFTTAFPSSRGMRDIHRQTQRHRIPSSYRHLIDFRFVLCSPSEDDIDSWTSLALEQQEYGDLFLLDDNTPFSSRMKENMDSGKSYRWMQELLRSQSGMPRQAWWYLKADEDTYTQIPRLLEWLIGGGGEEQGVGPSEPVYTGTTSILPLRYNKYFSGHQYGLSWPLMHTVIAADIPWNDTSFNAEDAHTGGWMYSLPPLPRYTHLSSHTSSSAPSSSSASTSNTTNRTNPLTNLLTYLLTPPPPSRLAPTTFEGWHVQNPDPLTGLWRLDMGERSGNVDADLWGQWVGRGTINGHKAKNVEHFRSVHEEFEARYSESEKEGKGRPSDGLTYMWEPPEWMEKLAEVGMGGGGSSSGGGGEGGGKGVGRDRLDGKKHLEEQGSKEEGNAYDTEGEQSAASIGKEAQEVAVILGQEDHREEDVDLEAAIGGVMGQGDHYEDG